MHNGCLGTLLDLGVVVVGRRADASPARFAARPQSARRTYEVTRAVREPTVWAKSAKPRNRCLSRLSPTRPTHL